MSEREEFLALLREFRKKSAKTPISNRYPWQSKLATVELLDFAKSIHADIRVLTGSGQDSFYGGEVEAAFRSALEKCSVKVLVWTDSEHPYGKNLGQLRKLFPQRMEVAISGMIEHGEEIPHFLAVGKTAYRLEAPHPRRDDCTYDDYSPETVAEICFNDPEVGSTLCGFFDDAWKRFGRIDKSATEANPKDS